MDKKKYKKENNLRLHFIVLGCIFLSTFFLSIGYSSFESIILNIDGRVTAVAVNEVAITDVRYSSDTNADINKCVIEQYYQTLLKSRITLQDDPNSSITYAITIQNSEEVPLYFSGVEYSEGFYDNSNIVFDIEGLTRGEALPEKQSVTFFITFHYLNNELAPNGTLNSYLNFKFSKQLVSRDVIDGGITINSTQVAVYNASTDKIPVDIYNSNSFPISLKLKVDNISISDLTLQPLENRKFDVRIDNYWENISLNNEYTIMIEQTEPVEEVKATGIKFQVYPTMANYELGLKSAGTETNPYLVHKIEDLLILANNVNSGNSLPGIYIKQTDNLDFSNLNDYYNCTDTSYGNLNGNNTDNNEILTEMTTGTGFTIIGSMQAVPFQGIYDGNNKRIQNLYISRTTEDNNIKVGVFGTVRNAEIKNLTVSGNYEVSNDTAGIIGEVYENVTIFNCHNEINISNSIEDDIIGGIVGTVTPNSTLNMSNCSNIGNINGGIAGGLIGVSKENTTVTINNSYNNGEITGRNNGGGLVSKTLGNLTIESCYNNGKVSGLNTLGGIVGTMEHQLNVINSYNVGIIDNCINRGGILGSYISGTYDLSRAYYLDDNTNLLRIGNIDANTDGRKSESYMKSAEFVSILGDRFINNNINTDYPVLK